jgi:hypothetical protein
MNLRTSMALSLLVLPVLFILIARRAIPMSPFVKADERQSEVTRPAEIGSVPVLVELFTSEGCSSCPPADALLSRLGKTQPVRGAEIIALEEHVNYWDDLGWKDPFSSEAATARQNEYGAAFGGKEIYTPQMIVDGRAQFVGSSDRDALRAVRDASQSSKSAMQLSWEPGDTLAIRVEPSGSEAQLKEGQLFLAVTEDMLHSDVRRGENSGRALEHNGVVRQLLPVGKINANSTSFSSTVAVHSASEWHRTNLRAVVFLQDRHTHHILSAGSIPFPS